MSKMNSLAKRPRPPQSAPPMGLVVASGSGSGHKPSSAHQQGTGSSTPPQTWNGTNWQRKVTYQQPSQNHYQQRGQQQGWGVNQKPWRAQPKKGH